MGNTTVWANRKNKKGLEKVRDRKGLKSINETLRYLLDLEKESELKKLMLTPDKVREILIEELSKVSRGY